MSKLFIPAGYESPLDLKETQIAIKKIKDFFQAQLTAELNLHRVTAPLFVTPESGLNDNLNGVERPVSFGVKEQNDKAVEVVHSLAKWKRMALGRYGFRVGEGLYTDMNAIRRDEDTDNIHSIYVDQWDWECIIRKEERNEETLRKYVKSVYAALRVTEKYIANSYDYVTCILPEDIHFLTTQELEDAYPGLTPNEREYEAAKKYGAIFLMKIGDVLASGKKHDGRAPDYDDWKLNGDIIVYYPVNDISLELSSMGIRVDEKSLLIQLEKAGCKERAELPFQKAVLNKELPYTIGGGIGQSRICMFFLRKCHIGEVQCSFWPEEDIRYAKDHGVIIL
ncbi:MAG: aspartate--ammonia ligase [Lachnospiraceae bacterium]|nr:aspartate--ammonia ligase [Lachnospiraceae bacterium]